MISGTRPLALLGLLLLGAGDPPLGRDQLVGDMDIPDWQENVRLCANGRYVHYLACGGIVRGEWTVEPSGLIFTASEVCLVAGVKGTKVGADGPCTRFKRYELLGCFGPEVGVVRAEERGIEDVRVVPEIAAAELKAMLAGTPPPGADKGVKAWSLRRTPEPKLCDPAYEPRLTEELDRRPAARGK